MRDRVLRAFAPGPRRNQRLAIRAVGALADPVQRCAREEVSMAAEKGAILAGPGEPGRD